MTDDELDALLTPLPPVPIAPAARAAALEVSTSALRRPRSWLRKWAAVAAGFALGVTVGWVAKPSPATPAPAPMVQQTEKREPMPSPNPAETVPPVPAVALNADTLEMQAEIADAATAAKLYRQAGDLYLKDSDIASAARCYRLHLTEAGREACTPSKDDSWLLLSMKSSVLKEIAQ